MKNSLFFSLMLLAPELTHAADLTIQIVEPSSAENAGVTPSATPPEEDPPVVQFKPIRSYVLHGAGLGYQNKSGDVESNGMYGTYQVRAHHSERDGWLAFGSLSSVFNVINKDARSRSNSTELAINASGFLGHGFDQRNEGVEFYIGLSGNVNKNASALSRFARQEQSRLGFETGLAVKTSDIFVTLSPSVGIGGNQCSIIDDTGQEISFQSKGISFAGVGRLLVGDKFVLNVLYMNISSEETGSSDYVDTTIYWKLGKKLTFTASCTFNHVDNDGNAGPIINPVDRPSIDYGQFQIGFMQQLNRNRRN